MFLYCPPDLKDFCRDRGTVYAAAVFSDAITKEVQIQDHCVFLSLHKSPEIWAEEI